MNNTGLFSIRLSKSFALCLLATLGEVSRERLVGEWDFDGDAEDTNKNYGMFIRIQNKI